MSEVVEPSDSVAAPQKSRSGDLHVIWHLLFRRVRGNTHAERLESFYSGQAEHYDSFRAKMLHGRPKLVQNLEMPENGVWVDMGGGTGDNVLQVADSARKLSEIHVVDLSQSLLDVAAKRLEDAGLTNAHVHNQDVTEFAMPAGSVDLVTFSYSLTMIPDWFDAIIRAKELLKPGGVIGVTDFYVSRKHAESIGRQHGWLRRAFWTHWFAADNVFLSGDHISMLKRHFDTETFDEHFGSVPYLPLLKAPYYVFVGRKGEGTTRGNEQHGN